MMDGKGMFTELMSISDEKPESAPTGKPDPTPELAKSPANPPVKQSSTSKKPPAPPPAEDINTVAYMSQNYRFTDSELRWIRQQSFSLTERLGFRVPQSTVLRIAISTSRMSATVIRTATRSSIPPRNSRNSHCD